MDVREWAIRGAELGAGEILLTSVDQKGAKGFDIDLIRMVATAVSVPVIASGGMGTPQDLVRAVKEGGADAAAMAHILHHKKYSLAEIREAAIKDGIHVRCP